MEGGKYIFYDYFCSVPDAKDRVTDMKVMGEPSGEPQARRGTVILIASLFFFKADLT